jgi:imidazolonepropionase-like amidohydrolase
MSPSTKSSILVAITGGYVVPVSSAPIANGTVLIEDGRITQLGKKLRVPKGATVIDARGKWVLPGSRTNSATGS